MTCDCDQWHGEHRFHCASRFPAVNVPNTNSADDPRVEAVTDALCHDPRERVQIEIMARYMLQTADAVDPVRAQLQAAEESRADLMTVTAAAVNRADAAEASLQRVRELCDAADTERFNVPAGRAPLQSMVDTRKLRAALDGGSGQPNQAEPTHELLARLNHFAEPMLYPSAPTYPVKAIAWTNLLSVFAAPVGLVDDQAGQPRTVKDLIDDLTYLNPALDYPVYVCSGALFEGLRVTVATDDAIVLNGMTRPVGAVVDPTEHQQSAWQDAWQIHRPSSVDPQPTNEGETRCPSCLGKGRYGAWAICPDCMGHGTFDNDGPGSTEFERSMAPPPTKEKP